MYSYGHRLEAGFVWGMAGEYHTLYTQYIFLYHNFNFSERDIDNMGFPRQYYLDNEFENNNNKKQR